MDIESSISGIGRHTGSVPGRRPTVGGEGSITTTITQN